MRKQHNKIASLVFAGLGLVAAAGSLQAAEVKLGKPSGMVVKSQDSDRWFELGGLVQFDEVIYDGSDDSQNYPSGSNIRRAQIIMKGGLAKDWSYVLSTDLSNARSATTGSDVLVANLTYSGIDDMRFTIGQFMPVMGIDSATAQPNIWMMERALPTNVIRPDFSLGALMQVEGESLNLLVDVFHGNDKVYQNANGSEPIGYSGRLFFVPVNDDSHLWHVGGSVLVRDQHTLDGGTKTFSSKPELISRNNNALSTGALSQVEEYQIYGFEGAARWNDIAFQGEYYHLHIDRPALAGGDLSYRGYYLQAAYTLTGERRPYNYHTGTFSRIKPVAKDGAWEVVARHSFMDLQDKNTGAPGSESNTTIGVNWWLTDSLSFAGNYVHASIPRVNQSSAGIDAIGLRAQFLF